MGTKDPSSRHHQGHERLSAIGLWRLQRGGEGAVSLAARALAGLTEQEEEEEGDVGAEISEHLGGGRILQRLALPLGRRDAHRRHLTEARGAKLEGGDDDERAERLG